MTSYRQSNLPGQYASYPSTGCEDIQYLLDSGLQTLFAQKEAKTETLVVFNPLSWARTDLATIKLRAGQKIASLKDLATGVSVPVQPISDAEVAFLAKDVPPFGYRTYSIVGGSSTASQIAAAPSPWLENSAYKIALRPTDGALASLLD